MAPASLPVLATPNPGCTCFHWALSLQWAPELPLDGPKAPQARGPTPMAGLRGRPGRAGAWAWGMAAVPSMASGPAGRWAGAAVQTSVLMLRLREKASRMADRRLGLSACRPPKVPGGSSRSSWPRLW